MRSFIRNRLMDPIVRRIEARLNHYASLRAVTHDGRRWKGLIRCAAAVTFYDEAVVVNVGEPDALAIGSHSCVRGELAVISPRGHIDIGTHCFVGPGTRIWSAERVTIGNYVMISHLVDIHDTNAHSLDWWARRQEVAERFERGIHSYPEESSCAPVRVEDDVWIGFKASILRGVTIGRGAVVAAASVVTTDVPAFTLVAGNPARVIRELRADEPDEARAR